ncbi:MAG: response regulator transcription factor [Gammaproteobacteria bacterium]|nr:response regulator transcription factor [Gammaproteobacteria bacterium]
MHTVSIILADDHSLVRAGIRELLSNIAMTEIVAEAGNGREVLKLVKEHQPRILLLDIGMPGLNGLEVAARVTKDYPGTAVIMLSMHANEEYVLQALRAGARGYLLKDSATGEIELAIRSVIHGKTYLSPQISQTLVKEYLENSAAARSPLERLTARQREILQLVAEGHTTRQIADMLNVSVKTVETHRAQLMERLEIRHVQGLTCFAIQTGLIQLDHAPEYSRS